MTARRFFREALSAWVALTCGALNFAVIATCVRLIDGRDWVAVLCGTVASAPVAAGTLFRLLHNAADVPGDDRDEAMATLDALDQEDTW